MEKFFSDLHFHTTDSDGTKTNAERIEEILVLDPKKEGIWATTNHDRFSPGFVEGARAEGIQSIWATEISAHSKELNLSLHITCYAPRLSALIASIVEDIVIKRRVKISGQISKLQARGFSINEKDFFQWITESGMSPQNATNYHIVGYLWKQKETLLLVKDLTNGVVTNEAGFLRECLRENGDFRDVGYYQIDRYEPDIEWLSHIAKKEDVILSVAHPNFSFTKKLLKDYDAKTTEARIEAFREKIVPIISGAGISNYEVNALARPEWKNAIVETTQKTGGLITFGSDNHGLDHADKRHGVLGEINPLLTQEEIAPILRKLRSFV